MFSNVFRYFFERIFGLFFNFETSFFQHSAIHIVNIVLHIFKQFLKKNSKMQNKPRFSETNKQRRLQKTKWTNLQLFMFARSLLVSAQCTSTVQYPRACVCANFGSLSWVPQPRRRVSVGTRRPGKDDGLTLHWQHIDRRAGGRAGDRASSTPHRVYRL